MVTVTNSLGAVSFSSIDEAPLITGLVNVLFKRVSASPIRETVPVAFGKVIV